MSLGRGVVSGASAQSALWSEYMPIQRAPAEAYDILEYLLGDA